MLIAATRWIHFCQLCPWFTSRPKIWTCQVRVWRSRKMCHLHVLEFPMPNRLPIPSGGGMPTNGELVLVAIFPYLEIR
jgi:hypothetical protein